MKIWRFQSNPDVYETLTFARNDGFEALDILKNGQPLQDNWRDVPVATYKKKKKTDFMLVLSVPIISEKARIVLEPLIANQVEILPLLHPKDKYFAINVINVIDCIDGSKAKFKLNERETVGSYQQYAFFPNSVKDQHIFLTRYHDRAILNSLIYFVSDDFRNAVLDNGLEGFIFTEAWDSEK